MNPDDQQVIMEKLYVILEAVTDRVEMHKNIGEQRNIWNSLLLTSINTITLTAATMAAITSSHLPSCIWQPQAYRANGLVEKQIFSTTSPNGWSVELEEEMREIIRVLEVKDKADYLRLGHKALKLNKLLSVLYLLTGLGAIGSVFLNFSIPNWAMLVGVMGGAMTSAVNSVQHGGQVGVVFEMYRSNAGFFKMMEETIESNMEERRENGQVFEMRVALQLGRSLSM
ncbi:hypothetical protein L1987_28361 [Smallanthus sonchifolius]|uniref:Uncharacterized protein n=1 Tax=Smallanthus sonchifolius TaxID=185202 RepID=A0ACB9HWF1_9ASTR|nr:hypothetical protein L1987_28361 [Smallanthus sonchifolius]